jgi:hypothetical protein
MLISYYIQPTEPLAHVRLLLLGESAHVRNRFIGPVATQKHGLSNFLSVTFFLKAVVWLLAATDVERFGGVVRMIFPAGL